MIYKSTNSFSDGDIETEDFEIRMDLIPLSKSTPSDVDLFSRNAKILH